MTKHHTIDLGNDGASDMTVELHTVGLGTPRWFFCRNGSQIREVHEEYLEGKLIAKILELEKQLGNQTN